MADSSNHRRPGFATVTPYLMVEDAQNLLAFLEAVFQATVASREDTPEGKIQNAEIRLGDSVLELAEARDRWGVATAALHVYVPDVDAVYDRALKAGATSIHQVMDMSYGERAGGFKDASGNQWYVATYTGGSA